MIPPIAALGVAVGLTVWVSSERDLSALEASLFQLIILAISLAVSYIFAHKAASGAAQDLIRPHARSAFRRVLRLYDGLFRLANTINERRQRERIVESDTPDSIQFVIELQIRTIVDALEDWRDIVPEDVEDIEKKLEQHTEELEDLRRR